MQEAFQKGFEDAFGKTDAVILPEKDIDQSLNAEGSAVYKAVVDGEMVGGAVVIINESTQHNHLDLLFVKNGVQSNGIGKKIWFELERIYPNTKVSSQSSRKRRGRSTISRKTTCSNTPILRRRSRTFTAPMTAPARN